MRPRGLFWIPLLSLAGLVLGCSQSPNLITVRPAVAVGPVLVQVDEALVLQPTPSPVIATLGVPVPPATALPEQAAVRVQAFQEPNDYAHRNYCGAGATQVLLSAWLSSVPDLELVAQRNALDPRVGQTGANTVTGINGWLDPQVKPRLGRSWYRAARVTVLEELLDILRQDIGSPMARQQFGHGAPVMVQAMTPTMPGWNRWNATHMITIYAYDLRSHDPARDTVSYVETPSSVAGYRGPATQTITVKALWEAMVAFYTKDKDPINVIW